MVHVIYITFERVQNKNMRKHKKLQEKYIQSIRNQKINCMKTHMKLEKERIQKGMKLEKENI